MIHQHNTYFKEYQELHVSATLIVIIGLTVVSYWYWLKTQWGWISLRYFRQNYTFLLYAGKVIVLEVSADKTKCTVVSRDQNAVRSHNIKTDNSSFERAEQFKYLGWAWTIKFPFRNKLRTNWIQGMFAVTRRITFGLPVFYPKI